MATTTNSEKRSRTDFEKASERSDTAFVNTFTSLYELEDNFDMQVSEWNASRTDKPAVFETVRNLALCPTTKDVVSELKKAGVVKSKVGDSASKIAKWLEQVSGKDFVAEVEKELEGSPPGPTLAIGVFFKMVAESWANDTDCKAVKSPLDKFLQLTTTTPAVLKAGHCKACYKVKIPGLVWTVKVCIESFDDGSAESGAFEGIVLPTNVEIDLDNSAFEPFMKGATNGIWRIIIAMCKGKLVISKKTPLSAEVATIVVMRTRGICMGPVPDFGHYDMRGKPLRITLFYEQVPLLQAWHN